LTLKKFHTKLNRAVQKLVIEYERDHSEDPEAFPLELNEDEWVNYFIERLDWDWKNL
jgi:hypothetical protein